MARHKKSISEKFSQAFATKLRKVMENTKTSQSALADEIGKSRQTISQYCNGESEPPFDTLVKIAKFFGVTIDWLLGASEDPNPMPSAVNELHLSTGAVNNLLLFSQDSDMYNSLNLILESSLLPLILNKLKAIPKSISAEIEYAKILEGAYIENSDEPEKKISVSDLGMLGQFLANDITARDLTNEILSSHPELEGRIVVIHGWDAIEKHIDDLGNDFAYLLKAETGYFELERIRFSHSIARSKQLLCKVQSSKK